VNEVIMLHGAQSRQLLQTIIDRKIPVTLSYLAKDGWLVSRAVFVEIAEKTFAIRITPRKKTQMESLELGQTIGISFKLGYGREYDKFVFDTMITGLSSSDPNTNVDFILALPQEIEMIPRRGYLRVKAPKNHNIPVRFWHRYYTTENNKTTIASGPTWQAKLIDVSASGMQVALPAFPKNDFKKGDNVGIKFTPLEFETPMHLNAQVRNTIPTADGKNLCIGLEMIGLEASPEGRLNLSRLVNVVEQYHKIDQS